MSAKCCDIIFIASKVMVNSFWVTGVFLAYSVYLYIYIYLYLHLPMSISIYIYIFYWYFNNIGPGYLRSEDGVVWLRYLRLNLYVYSSPFHLTWPNSFDISVNGDGDLSTLCRSCGFNYQLRVQKRSLARVFWLWHLLVNLYSFFFHEHSRFTGQQKKGKGISLTPHYHFHPLHRHLNISRAITVESLPLHIASS